MKAEAWRRKEYNKRRDLVLKTSGTRKAVFVLRELLPRDHFQYLRRVFLYFFVFTLGYFTA